MRRHSEYTRRLCSPYRASNDSESPPLALSIASASEMPEARIFFACVNSPYSGRYLYDAASVAVVVLTMRRQKTSPPTGQKQMPRRNKLPTLGRIVEVQLSGPISDYHTREAVSSRFGCLKVCN